MPSGRLRRYIRGFIFALCLLGSSSVAALAQIRIGVGIALPGIRIGVNIPSYPQLAPIPGYPVYYAPQLDTNLFFYDGSYWLFANDQWYSSAWYNGPWSPVEPYLVPAFILRVPIRFYRRPPPFFRAWDRNGPPRWGEHWGPQWRRRRPDWDRWDRGHPPPPAPLPRYQRNYAYRRYPNPEQQRYLQNRYYNHPGPNRFRQWHGPPGGPHRGPPPGPPRGRGPGPQHGPKWRHDWHGRHGPGGGPPN